MPSPLPIRACIPCEGHPHWPTPTRTHEHDDTTVAPEDTPKSSPRQVLARCKRVRFDDRVRLISDRPTDRLPESDGTQSPWWTADDYRTFRDRDRRILRLHEARSLRRHLAQVPEGGRDWGSSASTSSSTADRFDTTDDNDDDDDDDDDELCIRGLEARTMTAMYRRRQHRRHAIETVLEEQELQFLEGYYNDTLIADCYLDACRPSVREALHRAYCDQEYVEKHVRSTSRNGHDTAQRRPCDNVPTACVIRLPNIDKLSPLGQSSDNKSECDGASVDRHDDNDHWLMSMPRTSGTSRRWWTSPNRVVGPAA